MIAKNIDAWRAMGGLQRQVQGVQKHDLVPLPDDPLVDSVRGPSAWIAKEGEGHHEYTALLWLVGTRVVLEKFFPIQGLDGQGWFRRIADIDWAEGDVFISNETERGVSEFVYNINDPDLYQNDLVYIRQTEHDLAELIVGNWAYPPDGKVEELKFE